MGKKTVRGQKPREPNRPTMSLKKGTSMAMTAAAHRQKVKK